MPPIGTVMAFAGDTTDVGVAGGLMTAGWLPCDGSKLRKAQFNPLFAVIGAIYGDQGQTFKVPDIRGYFVIGAGGSRTVGSRNPCTTRAARGTPFTTDMCPDHRHTITGLPTDAHEIDPVAGWDQAELNDAASPTSVNGAHGHKISGGDDESRPINVYVDHIIRWQ